MLQVTYIEVVSSSAQIFSSNRNNIIISSRIKYHILSVSGLVPKYAPFVSITAILRNSPCRTMLINWWLRVIPHGGWGTWMTCTDMTRIYTSKMVNEKDLSKNRLYQSRISVTLMPVLHSSHPNPFYSHVAICDSVTVAWDTRWWLWSQRRWQLSLVIVIVFIIVMIVHCFWWWYVRFDLFFLFGCLVYIVSSEIQVDCLKVLPNFHRNKERSTKNVAHDERSPADVKPVSVLRLPQPAWCYGISWSLTGA
jgi:hypothetical protein